MFSQIFLSPQVKRGTIITYKHAIHELPNELPNNLRLRILGNQEISEKCLSSIEWYPSAQSPWQNEKKKKNSWKIEIKLLPHFAISSENHSQSQISRNWL